MVSGTSDPREPAAQQNRSVAKSFSFSTPIMAVLADQIAAFHSMLLQLSQLGLPIAVGNAATPPALAKQFAQYQQELERCIARGTHDPEALLRETSLPAHYCRGLQLWLQNPASPQALQSMLGPVAVHDRLRWKYRTAWLLPLGIAVLGSAVTLVTIHQLVPQFEELYLRAGESPGPIFQRLQAIRSATPAIVGLLSGAILALGLWLWNKDRGRLRNIDHALLEGQSSDHASRAILYANKVEAEMTSGPSPQSMTPLYSALGTFHQQRYARHLEPWLLVLLGGSFTILAALALLLPYVEFMTRIALPAGFAP